MKLVLAALMSLSLSAPVFAEETLKEKAKATGNDIARAGKKVANRGKEALCAATDTEAACTAKKAKHRVQEGAEKVGDKVEEGVNKID